MENNEFQCAVCKNIYAKGWSDEEAMEEARSYFAKDISPEECDILCDDCFNNTHPEKFPHLVEEAVMQRERMKNQNG